MVEPAGGPNLEAIRAWVLAIFGCVAIVAGIVATSAALVMVGFGALGFEPNVRAAVNGTR